MTSTVTVTLLSTAIWSFGLTGATQALALEPPASDACGDAYVRIHEIQGSGLASPLAGSTLSAEGVVVGEFLSGLGGFFLQDPTGDGDPSTSEGIFVFTTGTGLVAVGDRVRVRGTVAEFFDKTEIAAVDPVQVCSSGHTVAPTPISLPLVSHDELEPYENMLVTLPGPVFISEYFNFGRFGEIVLTTDHQFQPTAVFEPGSGEAFDLAQSNLLGRITLDDGRRSQNPDPAIHPNGLEFTLDNRFRGGDTLRDVTGVLDYAFGLYRIQPTQGAHYLPSNPRPERPDDVGGTLKVASMNVINYFTTLDDGRPICGPNRDQGCRGADSEEEFVRQRDKIIAALAGIDADVVGLIEIENAADDMPATDLVNGLNDLAGSAVYAAVATGAVGTDAIRVALIYKVGAVTPVGAHAILDASADPRFHDILNRPVLAQSFDENASGDRFTVVVTHLKSKGSSCEAVGDPDLGDGAGNCNLTRTLAAEALLDWLATDPTGSGDADVLIIGDLNAYDKEDPVDVLVAGGYTDLVSRFQGEFAYSYLFNGQLGYLDHALASPALLSKVTGTTVWHINADEPNLIDYDMTFKQDAQDALYAADPFRSSDHDPVIVGIGTCESVPPTLDVTVTPDVLWPPNHRYVRVNATVLATDGSGPAPGVSLISVSSNEPDDGDDDGNTTDDVRIIDDTAFDLRAERSGAGSGREYTITYRAEDACGNTTHRSVMVRVPLARGR